MVNLVTGRNAASSVAETSVFYVIESDGLTDWKVTMSLLRQEVLGSDNSVTVAAADRVYFLDASASPQVMGYATAQDIANLRTLAASDISSQSQVTAVSADYVLLLDTSTSPISLAKALVSDFITAFGVGDITGAGAITVAGGDLLAAVDVSASPQALGQVTAQAIANLRALAASDITGATTATATSSDWVLIADVSDSPISLKKALVSDLGSGLSVSDISGQASTTVAAGDQLLIQDVSDSPNSLKRISASDFATAAQGALADSALQNVSEDTTPTLGGDLDGGGFNATNLGDVTFKTGAAGGTLRTGTSAADKFQLQGYDNDDTTYRTVLEVDAGNAVQLQVIADYLYIEDGTDLTKKIQFDASGITTSTTRTITMPDADVNLGDIATNNAKVTNATHTGQVTGSGALTVDPSAISDQASVSVASGDQLLILDVSDSPNALKRISASDFATAAQANATHSGDAVGDTALTLQPAAITGKGAVTVAGGDLLLVTDVSQSPQALGQVTAQSIADLAAPQGTAIKSDDTSPVATDGYVLTADGAGGAAWEAAAGGGWSNMSEAVWTGGTQSEIADGASAIAFEFNTDNAYSTSGAKLASWKNNTAEKAYIDKDGNLLVGSGSLTAPGLSFTGDDNTGIYNTSDTLRFACGGSQVVSINNASNVLIRGSSPYLGIGADGNIYTPPAGTNFIAILNGTNPTARAGTICIAAKDSSDGTTNATLSLATEQAVETIGTFTASHKLKIWINGTEYWIQLDAV